MVQASTTTILDVLNREQLAGQTCKNNWETKQAPTWARRPCNDEWVREGPSMGHEANRAAREQTKLPHPELRMGTTTNNNNNNNNNK
eukprot:13956605-Alexandrium_andersonii.AAC.1